MELKQPKINVPLAGKNINKKIHKKQNNLKKRKKKPQKNLKNQNKKILKDVGPVKKDMV